MGLPSWLTYPVFCASSFLMPCLGYAATYAHVVMDPLSGKCLESKNGEVLTFPASLAKMMTLYLIFEALDKRKVTLNTRLTVSQNATKSLPSKLWVKEGEKLTLSQCILAIATRSCNDVCVVVAENFSGSVASFVKRMNNKAKLLKLTRTRFCNPSGWHHPLQKTCAKDMAQLLRALWLRFSHYGHFLGKKQFCFRGKVYPSTNRLLGKVPGLCMGKTGFTSPSGYNLSTLTARGFNPVIVVVMGEKSGALRDKRVYSLIEKYYRARCAFQKNTRFAISKKS